MHCIKLDAVFICFNTSSLFENRMQIALCVHYQTVTIIFIWKIGFDMCFRTSSASSHNADQWWLLYKIHFSSHDTTLFKNRAFLFRESREMQTSCRHFSFISVSSRGTPLSSFLTTKFLQVMRNCKRELFCHVPLSLVRSGLN